MEGTCGRVIRCGDGLTLESLNCPEVSGVIKALAKERLGKTVAVRFVLGTADADQSGDRLDELIRQGSRYDSFTVK